MPSNNSVFSFPYQANPAPTTHTPSRETCYPIVGRVLPLQQATSGISCRVTQFFGLATKTMNMRNNNDNNGGFLPDITLLTQCYYHRGTHLDVMKEFYICSL